DLVYARRHLEPRLSARPLRRGGRLSSVARRRGAERTRLGHPPDPEHGGLWAKQPPVDVVSGRPEFPDRTSLVSAHCPRSLSSPGGDRGGGLFRIWDSL